ncbi:transferase [Pseudomonas amygdali pv. eriobotryae]|nr:rhodanese-like domain-containing protein [Pseudomonas amygdali]GFZ62747.1 transferase [Pseudomonas amygdali pv. eriobotryae]
MNDVTTVTPEFPEVDVDTLQRWLAAPDEIAFVDIREDGVHGEGHPLLAITIPYSRLEARFPKFVPRPGTRIVLIADPETAAKAVGYLNALGYSDVWVLSGGVEAWSAAGEILFASNNVPSKAFAEYVEHIYHTPDIESEELDRLVKSGADVVLLDSRAIEEFESFRVPGAVSAPGVEMMYRFDELVPSPDTLVVVTCAGRTRGIIGAQALINAGVPNRVAALSGGTQGWRLSGFDLDRTPVSVADTSPLAEPAKESAAQRGQAVAKRFGVSVIDSATLKQWRDDPSRTTFIFDVRTPREYARGHLEGSLGLEGGMLVQCIDRSVGTRGARLVLVDDDGVRATLTAHWLLQLGWEAVVLPGLIEGVAPPSAFEKLNDWPRVREITATQALSLLENNAVLVSADLSADYRITHPASAVWVNRSRLHQLPATIHDSESVIVTGKDRDLAHAVARDLSDSGLNAVVLLGDKEVWESAGLEVVSSPDFPPDEQRIDYLFWLHDRHSGNNTSSRAYLDWELSLPAAIDATAVTGYRIPLPLQQ